MGENRQGGGGGAAGGGVARAAATGARAAAAAAGGGGAAAAGAAVVAGGDGGGGGTAAAAGTAGAASGDTGTRREVAVEGIHPRTLEKKRRWKVEDEYETIIEKIGEGTFGVVSVAKRRNQQFESKNGSSNRAKNSLVAIKNFKPAEETDGISFTAIREIMLLNGGFGSLEGGVNELLSGSGGGDCSFWVLRSS